MSDPKIGIGGAPTRATTLPEGAAERKTYPVASGFIDYFPDAIVAVAHISYRGNQQHNSGKPLHWDRSKSADEDDTIMRHFLQRGTLDTDGVRHSAKLAWRAMALLQKEIEAETINQVGQTALLRSQSEPLAPLTLEAKLGSSGKAVSRLEDPSPILGTRTEQMFRP